MEVGLALQRVELATANGKAAFKLRGEVVAATSYSNPDSFILRITIEQQGTLIKTEPANV